MSSQLHKEIHDQPAALRRQLEIGWPEVEQAADRIRASSPEWVLIAARGTSDNAARYAQYIFGANNGLGVGLAVPSLFTVYDAPPRMRRALTIGISQSGQSPDTLAVIAEARRQGGMTLAITNDPDSPLARASHFVIRLAADTEQAVAATKSYTNQLMVLAMLSVALEDDEPRRESLEDVADYVEETLEMEGELAECAEAFHTEEQFLVVGRGYNYCTAFEIALKMKQVGYVAAEPFSLAELLHGPVAMIDEGFPVMVIAPTGRSSASMNELMTLLAQRGAKVMALSNDDQVLSRAAAGVKLPEKVPEWISPMVAVVPGQLWAWHLALSRGVDPENPRGLSRVIRTF